MAPSAALQSRISVFEALEAQVNVQQRSRKPVQPPPLSVTPKVVEYHHGQNILESDSTSPTADSLCAIPPIQPAPSPSRPSSPAALGRKSSLIDFSELSSPLLRPISTNGTGSTTSSTSASDSVQKPPLPPRVSSYLPPLPPRKPSFISLNTTTSTTIPPPLPKRNASSPISSSIFKPSAGASLLPPSDTHTYPPTSPKPSGSPRFQSRHVPGSSTSSFHSVSLSSDSGGDPRDSLENRDSLDGSYEAVSSTAATSPTSHEWEHDFLPTSKLSQRSRQKQTTGPSIMNSPPPASHRVVPPPQRNIKPDEASSASILYHRPAPLPPNARKRYDAVFERNISHKGRAAGWRGFSVDLLTNDESDLCDETSSTERLDGGIVEQIWSCSKLPRTRLREIWDDCDPDRLGSLDKDAFSKGMWRIDEELRRGQNHARPSLLKAVSLSYAPRAPPQSLRKPNFLR